MYPVLKSATQDEHEIHMHYTDKETEAKKT